MASGDQLISEEIEVEYDKEKMAPTAFTWRGERYAVSHLLAAWQDWHAPGYAKHAQGWIHRRHRNCYIVKTEQGPIFELYLDRGAKEPVWVLLKRKAG
jgi:hypothetical protein